LAKDGDCRCILCAFVTELSCTSPIVTHLHIPVAPEQEYL
jgi:hypothetical protein